MKIPHFLSKRTVFIAATIIFIGLNAASLVQNVIRMSQIREKIPYIFMGYKFSGLDDLLKDSSYISYYTDRDMNDRKNSLQFAQAQYVLTPTILDRALLSHEYILLDCTSDQVALEKIRELGALPIRKNQFGIFLARNPTYQAKKQ